MMTSAINPILKVWTALSIVLLLCSRSCAIKYPPISINDALTNVTVDIDIDWYLSLRPSLGNKEYRDALDQACSSVSHVYSDFLGCLRHLHCSLLAFDNTSSILCFQEYSNIFEDDILPSTSNSPRFFPKYKYSSFTCMGGSQIIDKKKLRTSNTRGKFPLADPTFRVCKFHNVCLLYGQYPSFLFFEDPDVINTLPEDFQLQNFTPWDHLHLGYFSYFFSSELNKPFMPIQFVQESITDELFLHSSEDKVGMLVAHSWNNYGHHLFDVVVSMYTAALLYNIPISSVQPIFESRCKKFAMITWYERREGCIRLIEQFATLLSNNYPVFLDDDNKDDKRVCFRTLIAGFGSAFSQRAWDLSRDFSLRRFRDHVIKYLGLDEPSIQVEDSDKRIGILVNLRGPGDVPNLDFDEKINDMLCNGTLRAINALELSSLYKVNCFRPDLVSFKEEVQAAQAHSIIISYQGTIAYTSLFCRDNTQVILMNEDEQYEYGKDFQIFSRLTFVHFLWLPRLRWDHDLKGVLQHAIRLQNA